MSEAPITIVWKPCMSTYNGLRGFAYTILQRNGRGVLDLRGFEFMRMSWNEEDTSRISSRHFHGKIFSFITWIWTVEFAIMKCKLLKKDYKEAKRILLEPYNEEVIRFQSLWQRARWWVQKIVVLWICGTIVHYPLCTAQILPNDKNGISIWRTVFTVLLHVVSKINTIFPFYAK